MNGDSVECTGDTNAGGWLASEMRSYLNDLDANDTNDGVIYNSLPEDLRNGIISTYVVSSHGKNDDTCELDNDNFESTDKLYLLSAQEIYGTSFTSQYDSSNGTSRQLDYYANYQGDGYTGVSTTNYVGAIKNNGGSNSWWWLRSPLPFLVMLSVLSTAVATGLTTIHVVVSVLLHHSDLQIKIRRII